MVLPSGPFLVLAIVAVAVALAGLVVLVLGLRPGAGDPAARSRRFVLRLVGASLAVLGSVLAMVAVIASR
jgi:hypothetical protein